MFKFHPPWHLQQFSQGYIHTLAIWIRICCLAYITNTYLPRRIMKRMLIYNFGLGVFLLLIAFLVANHYLSCHQQCWGQNDQVVWVSEPATPRFNSRSLSPWAILSPILLSKVSHLWNWNNITPYSTFLSGHFIELMRCLFLPQTVIEFSPDLPVFSFLHRCWHSLTYIIWLIHSAKWMGSLVWIL